MFLCAVLLHGVPLLVVSSILPTTTLLRGHRDELEPAQEPKADRRVSVGEDFFVDSLPQVLAEVAQLVAAPQDTPKPTGILTVFVVIGWRA